MKNIAIYNMSLKRYMQECILYQKHTEVKALACVVQTNRQVRTDLPKYRALMSLPQRLAREPYMEASRNI